MVKLTIGTDGLVRNAELTISSGSNEYSRGTADSNLALSHR